MGHLDLPAARPPTLMYVVIFALRGSAAKIFWLIVFGVNEERYQAVEAAANA